MNTFLFNLANKFMGLVKVSNFIGSDPESSLQEGGTIYDNIITPITSLLSTILLPIIIVVAAAGSIFAIMLGVNFARAEDASKREEAKKRMINAIIAIVVTVAILIVLQILSAQAENILNWISSFGS